jgi:hypothetical protein
VLGITKEFAPSKKSLTAMSKYIHARHWILWNKCKNDV